MVWTQAGHCRPVVCTLTQARSGCVVEGGGGGGGQEDAKQGDSTELTFHVERKPLDNEGKGIGLDFYVHTFHYV